MKSHRVFYIDNLRIFLICLVVLHHLAITYGAPGGWYYIEGEAGLLASVFLTLFVASNQSYFMGLLFLVSACFTADAFERKGVWQALRRRLTRLGIPLLFFFFCISPLTVYHRIPGREISFWHFIRNGHGLGFGPLWFVETLLLFVLLYSLVRLILTDKKNKKIEFPATLKIMGFVFFMGIISFVIRLWFPIGWSLHPFNFQIAYFPQYIACLFLGVAAFKYNWFESVGYKFSMRWYGCALAMVFGVFPLMFFLGGAASGNIDAFMGGKHWQSFALSLWEQMTGFAFMIAFIGLFKKWFNKQGRLSRILSPNTYGVYVFHPLVLVLITVNLRVIQIPLFYKFILLAIPCLIVCFLFAYLFRQIPYVKKVM